MVEFIKKDLNGTIVIIYACIQFSLGLFVSIVGAIHVSRCIIESKKNVNLLQSIELNPNPNETITESPPSDQSPDKVTYVATTVEPEATQQEKPNTIPLEIDATNPKQTDNPKPPKFCSLWLRTIWKMRSVYGGLFVHCFDVLTDILVLIQWLRAEDKDGDNIDPQVMAYSAITVLFLSRVVSSIAIFLKDRNIRRAVLQFFDLLIFEEIYETHKKIVSQIKNKQSLKNKQAAIEATLSFKYVRHFEAVYESIPQSVLQLVYVIRTGDINAIFAISIAQSLISMANSIINNDYTQMQDDKFKRFKQRFPPTPECIKHALCRFSEISYRIGLLALFWTVCGGKAFSIMLAVDVVFITVKACWFINVAEAYQFDADTILLNLNQLIVLPSEEVYNATETSTQWYAYCGVVNFEMADGDCEDCALFCVACLANCCCCVGFAALLTAFSSIVSRCSCTDEEIKVYPMPTMRIGLSLVELIFMILYGLFAEDQDGPRRKFLLSDDYGLSIFIATCVFFLIYSQYIKLFPNFSLPFGLSVRSKYGYAYSNELSELQKIKIPIPDRIQDSEAKTKYNGPVFRPTTPDDLPRIVADFWDEKYQGLSAAGFAILRGHNDIVSWLEQQGAKAHIEAQLDGQKAAEILNWTYTFKQALSIDTIYGHAYFGNLVELKKITPAQKQIIYEKYIVRRPNPPEPDERASEYMQENSEMMAASKEEVAAKGSLVPLLTNDVEVGNSTFELLTIERPPKNAKEATGPFWDEVYRGCSAAVFALANGNNEVVSWLEEQGATWHLDRNIDVERAKEMVFQLMEEQKKGQTQKEEKPPTSSTSR